MSGGSYDYLYSAAGYVQELAGKFGSLLEMTERLDGIDPDSHAACDTREVLGLLRAAERWSSRLADVWHAVEWCDSNDTDANQLDRVLCEYEAMRAKQEQADTG
jgi:hypothetical protein